MPAEVIYMGVSWVLSTLIGVVSGYNLIRYRVSVLETRQACVLKELKDDVVHYKSCQSCKENILLKARVTELEQGDK